MPDSDSNFDLTSLIAILNALTQTLGLNGRTLNASLVAASAAQAWKHINSAGTFVVSGSPGTLFTVNVNTPVAGATVALYDLANAVSISGTAAIGTITLTSTTLGPIAMGPASRGLALTNGLVVVTTGTADLTIGV